MGYTALFSIHRHVFSKYNKIPSLVTLPVNDHGPGADLPGFE